MRKTNPISPGGTRENAQNEANFGRCGPREPPLFQCSIIPPFQSAANCAKRTQFGPSARERARAAGPGGPDAQKMQNEPNFRRSFKFEVSSVKRTVRNEPNLAVGQGPGGRNVQNEANWSPGRCRAGTPNLRRRANAQNEANSPAGALGQAGPIMRDKANWPPGKMSGEDAQPTQSRGAIVQNEANLANLLRQTKPISRRATPAAIPHYSSIPSFQYSNPSPLCKTKPIGRRSRYPTISGWHQSRVPR